MKLPRPLRLYYRRAQRLRGSVDSLALGAALGAAIATTPTMPLHSFITIAAALVLRVNVVAALLAGTLLSNPLTIVPQYYLVWRVGNFFFPGQLSWERIQSILHKIEEVYFQALTYCVVLAGIPSKSCFAAVWFWLFQPDSLPISWPAGFLSISAENGGKNTCSTTKKIQ